MYPPVAKTYEVSESNFSGGCGVRSYLDARECSKNQSSTASGSAVSLECNGCTNVPSRKLHRLILASRQSFELVLFESNFDAPVDETDGGGYASGCSDVPLDRSGRFQIDRVWHAMGDDSGFEGDDRLPGVQRLCDFGVNVYESIGLEGGGKRREAAFRDATEHESGGGKVAVNGSG